jgi:hypothetical protein
MMGQGRGCFCDRARQTAPKAIGCAYFSNSPITRVKLNGGRQELSGA